LARIPRKDSLEMIVSAQSAAFGHFGVIMDTFEADLWDFD
jgi:hypothetical protein